MNEYRYIGHLEENDYYLKEEPSNAFTVDEISTLKAINTPNDITSLVVGDNWTDDHDICVNVEVNGVKFAALWIVPSFFADIIYASEDVDSAKEQVIKYIKDFTDNIT